MYIALSANELNQVPCKKKTYTPGNVEVQYKLKRFCLKAL